MCSPDAATSPWVAAEIALFRELHPERPILAALLSGEPANAFPAALTANGNEPLAADLRPEGDSKQLGFLKIVAGIAGVPLDTLIQRDAQRRLRRVTAITFSALAAMLAMGIMTTFAIQARNEAARQRSEAEGLVEYMLTDLREKLRGVGRLDVMDAVNERAMEHYRRQGDLPGCRRTALSVAHACCMQWGRMTRSAAIWMRQRANSGKLTEPPKLCCGNSLKIPTGFSRTRKANIGSAIQHYRKMISKRQHAPTADTPNMATVWQEPIPPEPNG